MISRCVNIAHVSQLSVDCESAVVQIGQKQMQMRDR